MRRPEDRPLNEFGVRLLREHVTYEPGPRAVLHLEFDASQGLEAGRRLGAAALELRAAWDAVPPGLADAVRQEFADALDGFAAEVVAASTLGGDYEAVLRHVANLASEYNLRPSVVLRRMADLEWPP